MEEILLKSIRQVRDLLKKREITSVELTRFYLDRIATYDDRIKAYLRVTEEMAMRMAGFAFRRGAKNAGHVVIAFDVRLLSEIEIATVGLRFAGESRLQIFLGLAALERSHCFVLLDGIFDPKTPAPAARRVKGVAT